MQSLHLLKLMHLVSPALPIGAYAYSQGQEWAVDNNWINNAEDVEAWLKGLLQHSVAHLDLPALIRLYLAWQTNDLDAVKYWNQFVLASRETQELLLEDQQLGIALSRLLSSLDIDQHENLFSDSPSLVTVFALAGVVWQIPCDDLLQGYCWSWLENQVAAATKTVPLGQTRAQQILQQCMAYIPQAVAFANNIEENDIGLGLPGLAIASSLHERQYSRLFRS